MAPQIRRRTAAGLVLVALTVALGVAAAPALPERLTTHWNAAGTADGTLPRTPVLVGAPLLVAAIVATFEAIPRVDPLGRRFEEFRAAYDAFAVLTAGFLTYTYGVVLAWNLGYEFPIQVAVTPAVAVLFVAVGFLLERAERNWFVGIRTPWTLSSEAVWRHTHDLAATLFKLAGPVALGGLAFPDLFVYFVAGPAAGIALATTVYSYFDYRRVGDGDVSPPAGDGG
jgi:uncharacterized membrane protein